ncbi:MAG: polysaccharide biosynthesis tyrosine autokinase [Capsulimonadaceae bacterium]|nr:polysaccharide biosynthesis tyrosine autokinase [Capsulimonadaceae bacterium]
MNRRFKPLGKNQAQLTGPRPLIRARREDLDLPDLPLDTEQPTGLPFREYASIFSRRKWVLIETLIVSLVAGLLITHFTKPVYRATAKLEVENPGVAVQSGDASNPLSSLFVIGQQQPVDTQLELITASSLLNGVVQKVGPVTLSADIVRQTNVIEINGEASTPDVAANGANELMYSYIDKLNVHDVEDLKTAKDFVQNEGDAAARRLAQAQTALRDFQQRNNIVDVAANQADQLSRVATMQTDLNSTSLELNAKRQELAQLTSQLAAQPSMVTQRTLTTNPNIDTVRHQIANLQVEREGLTQPDGFTSSAAPVQAIDAQIAALQKRLAVEPAMSTAVTTHANDVYSALQARIADARVQIAVLATRQGQLQATLGQSKGVLARYPQIQMTMATLTRNVENAVAADKMFKSQFQDLSLREKARPMPVHIVEPARVPDSPVRPKPLQNMLMAAAVGLFLGIILVLIKEYTDEHIHTGSLAQELLNLPVLGEIRYVRPGKPILLPQMPPTDPIVEAYRIIRASIEFAAVGRPTGTLLVTSSLPQEGKSTVAANIAFAMAMDGKRVILVDADLRRPSLHAEADKDKPIGLSDALAGLIRVEDALIPYQRGLDVQLLSAGSMRQNPAELLGGPNFREVLAELETLCDLVIVDSSPMLAVSDTRRMASAFDGVVVIMEAGKTSKDAIKKTASLLADARANVLGLILNKVRVMQSLAPYSYGYGYVGEDVGAAARTLAPSQNGNGKYRSN